MHAEFHIWQPFLFIFFGHSFTYIFLVNFYIVRALILTKRSEIKKINDDFENHHSYYTRSKLWTWGLYFFSLNSLINFLWGPKLKVIIIWGREHPYALTYTYALTFFFFPNLLSVRWTQGSCSSHSYTLDPT